MKKNIIKIAAIIMSIISIMFVEYRVIMRNATPHVSGNVIAIEVFGQVDYYDYDEWKQTMTKTGEAIPPF